MQKLAVTEEQVWEALDEIVDPEIPVVSVVEMGIIRGVAVAGESVKVQMTPTFSGCPALQVMEREIEACLYQMGFTNIEVEIVLNPPWTTEWIQPSARQKLKGIGLAPPPRHDGDFIAVLIDPVACSYCGSEHTTLKNSFGPTPSRMIYYCNNCTQPFEQFKPL